jgi:uncharacterized protein
MNPFHLSIPVHDIDLARDFYLNTLGCSKGRSDSSSDSQWVDFNFFGHQLVCHLDKNTPRIPHSNPVDNHDVPIPHFDIVLNMAEWQPLATKLITQKIDFIIQRYVRFKCLPSEQATMFFSDPSGNAIEIKAFHNIATQLFAHQARS